ncbi:hypothetical protein FOCC_FOCC007111 [Frankliniella occidentalis]|nr:hypothetical protein FOCC_FOCC007111 [Frankliniella occidentalis]
MSCSKFTFRQKCPVFDTYPCDLNESRLPTYKDVLLCCLHERRRIGMLRGKNIEPLFSEISETVANKVENIFIKASIPTVSHTRVIQLLKAYHNKYITFKKVYLRDKTGLQERRDSFVSSAQKLFDIASCKCASFESCTCPKEKKVPLIEQPFLLDQRSRRIGKIGSVDLPETKKLLKRSERKSQIMNRHSQSSSQSTTAWTVPSCSKSRSRQGAGANSDKTVSNHLQTTHKPAVEANKKTLNTVKLEQTALAAQRFGVSDRAAALIVSSAFLDAQKAGLITTEQARFVSDRCKIRRAKEQIGAKLQETEHLDSLLGLYFDGRKDKTLQQVTRSGKLFKNVIKEEHISLVAEPGSQYIGHVACECGQAESEFQAMWQYFEANSIDLEHLQVVGADGTNTNTGWKGGIIRKLEQKLGRPLQWIVCLLHFNELPFRALFEHIDGGTSGPKSFTGPIGSQLSDCENLPVVKFAGFPSCQLPDEVIDCTKLSTDQCYLYKISQAVISGNCPPDVAELKPGNMCKSRWLTCANRILRLYVSTNRPTNDFKTIVKYILTVYSPLWFSIRFHSSIKDGSRHLFDAIQKSRYLPAKLRKIVDASIQQNAYFAFPENILLSMMTDAKSEVRKLALDRLLTAREVETGPAKRNIRFNLVPTLNFKATNYYEIIDWKKVTLTVPPVLRSISNKELINGLSEDSAIEWDFQKFPCHTVAVERTVKLVTEASQAVYGPEARDRFIRTTLKSRQQIPKFASKSDFIQTFKSETD